MALGIRIYLRALQFLVRTRYGRPTDGLLSEIETLSRQATDREGWGVLGAAVLLSRRLSSIDRLLGMRLLRRAFELTKEFRNYLGREVEMPEGMGPECLIWGVALDLETESELSEWIAVVDALDSEKRRRAFSDPMSDAGCMMVGGALFRAETKKPEHQQNWRRVLDGLDSLADWARQRGLEVLWACAVRHRVIILGENLRELDSSISTAEEALSSASEDPRVRFLLSDSIGEFLLRANRTAEALACLERALSNATDSFVLERLLTLVNASRATAAAEPTRCLGHLREAGRAALACADLPGIEVARVHGEIAIGEGLAGNMPQSFRALDYGVEQMLKCRADTNQWKTLFLLFGHTSGYFMSIACRRTPPERTQDGEVYAEPRRGCFYSHDRSLGDLYDESKVHGIALQLALFADAIGEDSRAAAWSAKALELARESGKQPVVEELTRRFIPQLIVNDCYADAIEAALEHGAVLMARSLELQAGRGDLFRPALDVEAILGERPNANWRQAEGWSAMAGVLPVAVRISSVGLDQPEAARASAEEVVSICRQIGAEASDPDLWSGIADLFEKGFVQPVPADELKRIADSLPATSTTLRALALLFTSMQPGIIAENALAAQLSVLPCLEQTFDRPFTAHRLILVPFVSDYWNAMFRRQRLRFRLPGLVQSALAEATTSPPGERIRAVVRAMLIGIPLHLPPEIRNWLDTAQQVSLSARFRRDSGQQPPRAG
jgi:hypothetical protein